MEIKEGDILILHTGYHRYYEGQPQQGLVPYFCMHPGGKMELLEWMLAKKIKWFGIDAGSGDHPMNASIRHSRADLAKEFEAKVGMSCGEFFGEYEYTQKLTGRRVKIDYYHFPNYAFQECLTHAENVGGDIERVLNQRCVIGAFPWRYDGLESCPCRIICFFDVGEDVEAVGNAAKAIF